MIKDVYKDAADFSGGEKQKLLLAKAIYKNAPVLILDEPTAALDPIAENEIYSRFNSFVQIKRRFIFLTGFQAAPSAIKSPCLTTRGLSSTERIASFWVQAANTASFGMRRQGIISHKGLGE